MKCPHCHQGTIVKDNWHQSEAVRCPICEWWKPCSVREPMGDFGREEWLEAGAKANKDQQRAKRREFVPCPVVGCSGKMMRSNPNGMCGACLSALRSWERGKQTTPAPIQQDADGTWRKIKRMYVMEAA